MLRSTTIAVAAALSGLTVSSPGLAQPPVQIVENCGGLYPDEVAFWSRGADRSLFFTPDGVTVALAGDAGRWAIRIAFVDATPGVTPEGEAPTGGVVSVFGKTDASGLRCWGRVVYRDLWPGVDLVYRAGDGRIKYEFRVAAGADPSRIRLRYEGVTRLSITTSGALLVETPVTALEDAAPVAFQRVGAARTPVASGYRVDGTELGFAVGDYDRSRPLVIDPVMLVFAGYFGGANTEDGTGVDVDAAGNVYLVGTTTSAAASFPVRVGPFSTPGGSGDAFVAKLDPSGTRVLYCGYIGGSGSDVAQAVAVDGAGRACVVGWTTSTEATFPVIGGPDLTMNNRGSPVGGDAFVARVNATGTALDYCGYIGGAGATAAIDVAVDATGNAYVTGWTFARETSFPIKVGPGLVFLSTTANTTDAFVAKVNATGSTLDYCGYIGGIGDDRALGVAVDPAGRAYVTGYTASNQQSFPVRVGPFLTYFGGGGADAFVARVTPTGNGLEYCGYLGGNGYDFGHSIAVDATGDAYVVGGTSSNEQFFPVAVGPDLTHNGGADAFIAKIPSTGVGVTYCGYIGGSGTDAGWAVAIDASGRAHVGGHTTSTEATFPVLRGPDTTYNGGLLIGDGFVSRVDASGTRLEFCGYVGGTDDDWISHAAVDGSSMLVIGTTGVTSQGFPTRFGPFPAPIGRSDAFVAKVADIDLSINGTPRPGQTLQLGVITDEPSGLAYQIASSFGAGPTPLGAARSVALSTDGLLALSTSGTSPVIFGGYAGRLDAQGGATASLRLPGLNALVGQRVHSAFVVFDPAAALGIRTISSPAIFTIIP